MVGGILLGSQKGPSEQRADLDDLGCRHIDCSSQPDNEVEIGKAMAETCGDWIVNRPDIFVTARMQEASPEKMAAAAQAILLRLQTKYVDLLLLPADHIEGTQQLEVEIPRLLHQPNNIMSNHRPNTVLPLAEWSRSPR